MSVTIRMTDATSYPLISILMGAYNCADTLESAVTSIQNQTYTNWEFIICDDCSTDNTWDVLKKLAARDSRIHLLRNEQNMRLAYSLNHCLKYAHGKYIARMDADDESLPTRFEKQVQFLEEHPEIDLVGTGRIIFDENGNETVQRGNGMARRSQLIYGSPFAHPTIMMKAEVLKALNGYRVSKATMRAEDAELWFRFFEQGYSGYNLEEPLYRYRETLNDYKKRTVKAAAGTVRVMLDGYKRLGFPWYVYPLAFKPLLAALVPDRIMKKYHQK